jgi:hypothetical protein
VSLGDEADHVLVKFWGAPYILTDLNKPIFKEPFALRVRIPLQTDSEDTSVIATQVLADSAGKAGETILWIQFAARILFKGAMDTLLEMLGFLQLIIYFPLVDVKFPPTALLLYNQITQLVTFDLVPTDDYYPQIFDFPDNGTLNDDFADFDFKQHYIMNMGSLFLMITVTLIQFPIYYLARWMSCFPPCKKIEKFYAVSQFWGTPLDVIMGSYIEIMFACLINWMMFTTKGDTHNYGVFINNVYLIASSVLLVAFPFWLYFFLKKNYYDLQFKTFSTKYSPIYDKVQLFDNEKAIWVPILYCLRRAALALTCCCLIGHPLFQFMALFSAQTVALVYLGEVKPYESRYEMRVDYFNESMIYVLIYHLMLFTREHIHLADFRYAAGISLIFCTIFLVFVNVTLIIIPSVNNGLLRLKRRYLISKAKEI